MSERFISVNPDSMESGKFYRVYTDKDNATLIIKKEVEDTLYSDVETLKTTQSGLVLDVTNAKDDINNLETNYTNSNTRITNLETDNTINKNSIQTLNTEVGEVNSPISQCWVSPLGNDNNSGTIHKPFKTVQKALTELFGLINILPGTYTEDLNIPSGYGLYGPVISCAGTFESPKAFILGTITIPTGVSRVRFKNVLLDGKGVGPAIVDNSGGCRHVLENTTVSNPASGGDLIRVVNGKNWWNVEGSTIEGTINLSGTGNNMTFNIMNSPNSFLCNAIVNAGYTFTAFNVNKMGLITHNRGNVLASYVSAWYPTAGKIINSTSTNALDVIGVGYSAFTADTINYGTISSNGATVIKNFNTEALYNDVCLSAVSLVNTLITTTAQTLKAEVKKLERNISYSTSTGELTFNKTGSYDISIMVKIDCSEWNKKVELWIEKYNPTTTNWDAVADTGFMRMFQTDQEVEVRYDFASFFNTGDKYRLRASSDSNTTITTSSPTLTNNIKMPSVRISVYA